MLNESQAVSEAALLNVNWKCGFEIELMAPPLLSREEFARAFATRIGGTCDRIFYPQSELSTRPNQPPFETLTLGFAVRSHENQLVAQFVDDVTLERDLDHNKMGREGWYRVLSPHSHILRLIDIHGSATSSLETVLQPLANLFSSKVEKGPQGLHQVRCASVTLALALPVVACRERACEVISAPLSTGHLRFLEEVVETAKHLNFFVPQESATHIHFEARKFEDIEKFRKLVAVLVVFRSHLRAQAQFNENCTRLGAWPADFLALALGELPTGCTWLDFKSQLSKTSVRKWCDFNILGILFDHLAKPTIEVRIIRTKLNAQWIFQQALFFASLFEKVLNLDDSHWHKVFPTLPLPAVRGGVLQGAWKQVFLHETTKGNSESAQHSSSPFGTAEMFAKLFKYD